MIKTSLRLLSLISISLLLITFPRQNAHAQEVVASYQTFYDQLAPYGQWVTDPQYGDVWVPNVEPGFRPYATDGHWAMTDYGNMWVSDEPFGWAVYHYGRWTYNQYYGWVWIPGSEWAPAWVSWRNGGGYYGWAPMGPGYEAGGSYAYPDNYWVFVGPENLYRPNPYSYYDYNRNFYFIQHTAYMHEMYQGGGMTYNFGPRPAMIERDTHQPVQVYRVGNAGEPRGSAVYGNTVNIYRPSINAASERTSRPANVIQASQPIGKPQDIVRGHENDQPGFRQEVQQHQATQARNQNNAGNNNFNNRGQQPIRGNQFQNGGSQQNNRPQAQHFQQQNTQQANTQQNRQQPTVQNQQQSRPQAGNNQMNNRQQSQPQSQQQRPQQQQTNTRQQPQQAHQLGAPREEHK